MGWHPGQVTDSSQSQHRETNDHPHSLLQTTHSCQLAYCACLWTVGASRSTWWELMTQGEHSNPSLSLSQTFFLWADRATTNCVGWNQGLIKKTKKKHPELDQSKHKKLVLEKSPHRSMKIWYNSYKGEVVASTSLGSAGGNLLSTPLGSWTGNSGVPETLLKPVISAPHTNTAASPHSPKSTATFNKYYLP